MARIMSNCSKVYSMAETLCLGLGEKDTSIINVEIEDVTSFENYRRFLDRLSILLQHRLLFLWPTNAFGSHICFQGVALLFLVGHGL
jgi:hypothetical protein